MARNINWTEEQIIVVLYEYCRKPFGQFSATKKFVKDLGDLIGRSPAAIVRKVGNLASFDPKMRSRGVTGLAHSGNIVDWNISEENRTNPENGLCLNPLFHKAYDNNLLGITPDYEIIISEEFLGSKLGDVGKTTKDYIWGFNKRKLFLPRRFYPDKELLAQHYETFRRHEAG